MESRSEGETTDVSEESDSQCRAVVPYSADKPSDFLSWEADRAWSGRLLRVCSEGVRHRYLAAWFSTLGGAHSALGDSIADHAKKAGLVSKQQLALAELMGDPLLVSRCKLYVAFSLLQRGRVRKAARIIREQYQFASLESPVHDKKLVDMCLAGWARVQELKPSITTLSDSIPTPTDFPNNSVLSCGVQFQHHRNS